MRRLLPLILSAVALTGCAGPLHPRELEQLQLIQTLGCDGEPGALVVSVSSGGDPAGENVVRMAAPGRTVTEAVARLQADSAREELFFAHVRFAVLGEEAARAGLAPLLDYFERSTQTPLDLPLFVVRGATARELTTGSEDSDYEATALLTSLQRDAERMGSAHCFTLLDMARQSGRSGTALCAAVRLAPTGETVPSAEDGLRVLSAGYALWKADRLSGFLDEDAALGADMVLGFAPRAMLVLPAPSGGRVTAQLRRCRARIAPGQDAAGTPSVHITLECRAGIVEAENLSPLDDEALRALSRALADAVADRVSAAIRATQALDTDALELCRRVGVPAASYASLPWRVDVTAAIERSFDINESGEAHDGP